MARLLVMLIGAVLASATAAGAGVTQAPGQDPCPNTAAAATESVVQSKTLGEAVRVAVEADVIALRRDGTTVYLLVRTKATGLGLQSGTTMHGGDTRVVAVNLPPNGKPTGLDLETRLEAKAATYALAVPADVAWAGPQFDAAKNCVAIEKIEIAHEGMTLS